MTIKCTVFAALLFGLAAGGRVCAQQAEAGSVASSTQPAAEAAGKERDPLLLEKLRDLKKQLHEEFHKQHGSTPEEASAFRTKAVSLSIEYYNLLHEKSQLPLMGSEAYSIHQLIYARSRIAAHIFGTELEIFKSTDAYDYKAQAEAISGDKDQAEDDWTIAIAMSPEAELLRHRGHMYYTQRKYDRAIEDYSRAIKAGGIVPLYHSRALAYYRKDDYAAAAEDLEQFFKLNTDKEYSRSLSGSQLCLGLHKHGFAIEGCAVPENGGEKK